jgi:hypothetical protein
MKNLKFFNLLLLLCLTFFGCSKDDNTEGGIKLTLSAVNSESLTKNASFVNENNATVVFTDFRISIRDVIFKNDDDINSSLDTDEVQFRGPYQIDLLDNTSGLTQTIGNAIVPDGHYKEMRFKFHKDEDLPANDNLYDRSIYMAGTIDDIPFIFWHDTSENFDLGRNTGVLVKDGIVNFTVQFDISQFLSSLHQIDFSLATDNNNDGLIEIYPNDVDGNQSIAADLKENIKMAADLTL